MLLSVCICFSSPSREAIGETLFVIWKCCCDPDIAVIWWHVLLYIKKTINLSFLQPLCISHCTRFFEFWIDLLCYTMHCTQYTLCTCIYRRRFFLHWHVTHVIWWYVDIAMLRYRCRLRVYPWWCKLLSVFIRRQFRFYDWIVVKTKSVGFCAAINFHFDVDYSRIF